MPEPTLEQSADTQVTAAPDPELLGMTLPGSRRIGGWLFWVVFPVASVAVIVLTILGLMHHLNKPAYTIPGSFTVTARGCEPHICAVTGTFFSDDGRTIRGLVPGDPRWQLNSTHRAYFDAGSSEARSISSHWDPSTSIMALTGAGVYLLVVGWLGWDQRHRRKQLAPTHD